MMTNFWSDEALITVVTRFHEALNGRDLHTMMQMMTEDCVFENTYPPPDGTRYEGQTAVREFWQTFFQNANQSRFDIEEIFAGQDRCTMRWVYHWVDQEGQAGHIRGVDVYRLSHGLIAEKLSYVKG